MSRQILAIDIRNDALAAVLLNTGLKTSIIQNCAFVPLSADPEDAAALSAAVSALSEKMDISGSDAVVSLPAGRIFYRNARVPFKEEKKIRQVLPFELEPSLPVAVDRLAIDFQKGPEGEQTKLLATAMDRQLLQYYMEALTEAGVRPQLVVPGAFPLALGLLAFDHQFPEHALVIDLEGEKATLLAVENGHIALVRSLPAEFNGDASMDAFALRVRQTVTAYTDTNSPGFDPEAVYLTGPALRDSRIGKRLLRHLDKPTLSVNLREHLPRTEMTASVDGWSPYLMDNALALALLESEGKACPNFHRSSSPLRNYWTAYRSYIKGPAILLALVLMLGLSGVIIESSRLQKRVDWLDNEMEQVFSSAFPGTQRVGSVQDQMQSELIKVKQNAINPNSGVQVRRIDILYEISERIPKSAEVLINRMVVGDETVTISGETAAFNVVDDIKSRLEGSAIFKQVTIASANMDKSGNKVRFKLKIDL